MKVFSLTDVETPTLKKSGFVGHTIAVGEALLSPGGEADVTDETLARVRSELQGFVACGALALGERPPEYLAAKARAQQKAVTTLVPSTIEEPMPPTEAPAKRRR